MTDAGHGRPPCVVLVDDNPDDLRLVARQLQRALPGVQVEMASDATGLGQALERGAVDVVVTDYQLKWTTGMQVLRTVKERAADVPVIMFTATGSEEIAVAAMKAGLDDYITKTPAHYAHVPRAVERAVAHAAARRDRSRQAALLELTDDAILVRDRSGRIRFWNRGAERLYGWTAADVLGRSADDRLGTEYPVPRAAIERDLEAQGRWSGELRRRAADGRDLVVLSRCRLVRFGPGGEPEVLESDTDITARKHAEEALVQADRRKTEFLATLAHELRNPLAPIRTAAHILKAGGTPLTRDQERARAMIERQVEHLVHLVDDLLDVSRISQGRIELRRSMHDLRVPIRHAVETTAELLDSAGLVRVLTLPEQPIMVYVDSIRITQAVTNLLTNAAKFTPAGGRVEVRAESGASDVSIRVLDTGVGIPPEMIGRIFELFEQVHPGVGVGLGVGLALTRQLVELHGGWVEAHSAGPGSGSEFAIHLPVPAGP